MLDINWWRQLTPEWKHAFTETFFRHSSEPTSEELAQLYNAPALRFAGPNAPYPNMSIELPDLSGITALIKLETLVATHQKIVSIKEVSVLKFLKHLFLFNNEIKSLNGIEDLTSLEQLYVQWNQIESLEPLQKLLNLREVYIHNNLIFSLEILTEEHAEKLQMLVCKPNDNLKQKELLRVERELGIRCISL